MPKLIQSWDDERMRNALGSLLRVGVIAAAIIAIYGGILFFIQHPKDIFDYSTFKGEPSRLRHVHVIIRQAIALKSRAVIQFGILLLIATPVARVFFSLIGFFMEKDWIYTIITFLVLFILFFSLFNNYFQF